MGRTSVITITMIVFLVLGNMAVVVLVGAHAVPPGAIPKYLAHQGWWLLFVPAIWALFANVAARVNRGLLTLAVAHGIGIGIVAVLVLLYGIAVFT
jgi:hypothetical protein